MKIESKEISEHITGILNGIKNSESSGYSLDEKVDFELAIVNKKGIGANIEIFVVGLEGKYSKDQISKISFSWKKNPSESDLNSFNVSPQYENHN